MIAVHSSNYPETLATSAFTTAAASARSTADSKFSDAFVKLGLREGRKVRQTTNQNARFLISNFDSRGAILPLIAAAPPNLKPARLGAGLIAIGASAAAITSAGLASIAALLGVWGNPKEFGRFDPDVNGIGKTTAFKITRSPP